MTKREARKWVRQHWSAWMAGQDAPYDMPAEVGDMWRDETQRIAQRIVRND
jgi:hypothetical protein